MNSLLIVFIAIGCFFFGYRVYAKKLEHLWQIDPKRATPAYSKFDSVDYVPAKNWLVLFGHHFSSIAGAGPIIGPVIAVMLWGWMPALVWIIVGTIFIGGVHDFGSLITSIREGGSSISNIAEQVISRRAKIIFALFLFLALILVIAVFAWLCADTLVNQPRVIAPSFGLIPLAILIGYLLYSLRANQFLVTLFGLVSLVGLVLLGNRYSINADIRLWVWLLFGYCYCASVLPVNILLQPRDYLASFLLFFCIIIGYISVVLFRPPVTMPYFHSWNTSSGALWPMMFITVACGAVSGFHALISSGTSSKQIASESHAKMIGYGGMVTEGLLAVLVVISVATLFKANDDLPAILKNLGPIGIFGRGYGLITSGLLGANGQIIALTILNAFILTTLDTATRIARYILEELVNIKNRYISTAIVVFISAALCLSGKWSKIWLAFGASNQLVAALALFVISCWLLSKKSSLKFTIIPALFMLVTTVIALVMQSAQYYRDNDRLLFIVCVFLMLLSGFIIYEILSMILRKRKKNA